MLSAVSSKDIACTLLKNSHSFLFAVELPDMQQIRQHSGAIVHASRLADRLRCYCCSGTVEALLSIPSSSTGIILGKILCTVAESC